MIITKATTHRARVVLHESHLSKRGAMPGGHRADAPVMHHVLLTSMAQ